MSLFRRMVIMAIFGALLCVTAGTSSAAEMKATSACNTVRRTSPGAHSSTNAVLQPLTYAQVVKTANYCRQAQRSANTLRWWSQHANEWRLYKSHYKQKCWQIPHLRETVKACMDARRVVRQQTLRLAIFNGKASQLLRPRIAKRLVSPFTCIHRHEAAWNDTGAPYWGGLQMDRSFMRAYGAKYYTRWGTADNWPIWAQLVTAALAYKTRGFGPWPNTARACGLPV